MGPPPSAPSSTQPVRSNGEVYDGKWRKVAPEFKVCFCSGAICRSTSLTCAGRMFPDFITLYFFSGWKCHSRTAVRDEPLSGTSVNAEFGLVNTFVPSTLIQTCSSLQLRFCCCCQARPEWLFARRRLACEGLKSAGILSDYLAKHLTSRAPVENI